MNIIIFAKSPIPGFAKTRLIPEIGAKRAAKLHEKLVKRTFKTCNSLSGANVSLWVTEPHPLFTRMARSTKAKILFQPPGDLGQRMAHALLAYRSPTVIVGTDCPTLATQHLCSAFSALKTHALTVCPAEDGGFALIGATNPQELRYDRLFSKITWGTGHVLSQLKHNLQSLNQDCAYLEQVWDVDTPADYHRLVNEAQYNHWR